ncbi:MAG: glycosyltransferase family 2 protein [Rickettsiales bacterium]|nr:glycosyltransferase family 2 protein [Rickettsiales bacterium]
MSNSPAPLLSAVVPIYNESDGLDVLFGRLIPILDGVTADWEIICVNDGSADDSLVRLRQWRQKDARIKLLSLSRNFGKEAALTAGLHNAYGQAVIPLDADLQDPPELIPEMVRQWQAGYKVVLATRKSRSGESYFKRATAWLYYRLMQRLLTTPLPANTGDFRLMDQKVIEVIRLLPERARFMKGLFAWVGFSTTQLYFDRPNRAVGHAKQNYRKLWALAKDGIFSFTTLPLRVSTYLGVAISTVAFSYAGWLLLRTMIYGVQTPGYASIMATVLCMGGIQLISIGIVGEYLGRIYRETKQRPLYVIEETAGIRVNT